ncbi:OLC1v1021285C1 [Oldenlandia corymbosa var. corymbosa]|uniref:OLC1v1021285C1 n=1 Tax=Oldenlandia corymbosa var. corymbosa TaxID=529605 RepID=A0AAV1BWH2_OLDCO|nr:OLC1v1021285C1 [Oldenlandia corymbosa var. corymbosa]
MESKIEYQAMQFLVQISVLSTQIAGLARMIKESKAEGKPESSNLSKSPILPNPSGIPKVNLEDESPSPWRDKNGRNNWMIQPRKGGIFKLQGQSLEDYDRKEAIYRKRLYEQKRWEYEQMKESQLEERRRWFNRFKRRRTDPPGWPEVESAGILSAMIKESKAEGKPESSNLSKSPILPNPSGIPKVNLEDESSSPWRDKNGRNNWMIQPRKGGIFKLQGQSLEDYDRKEAIYRKRLYEQKRWEYEQMKESQLEERRRWFNRFKRRRTDPPGWPEVESAGILSAMIKESKAEGKPESSNLSKSPILPNPSGIPKVNLEDESPSPWRDKNGRNNWMIQPRYTYGDAPRSSTPPFRDQLTSLRVEDGEVLNNIRVSTEKFREKQEDENLLDEELDKHLADIINQTHDALTLGANDEIEVEDTQILVDEDPSLPSQPPPGKKAKPWSRDKIGGGRKRKVPIPPRTSQQQTEGQQNEDQAHSSRGSRIQVETQFEDIDRPETQFDLG